VAPAVIGFDVGPCELGAARARHALAEVAVMAGVPAARDDVGLRVAYGARTRDDAAVVIPHETAHVPRDVEPDGWGADGGDVPLLFAAGVPEGDVVAASREGHPLLVRAGRQVYLGFDLVRAADYYLNAGGEVGWPRDAAERPLLAGAPAWRRKTVGVAVVNRYAALFARALALAADAADVPLLRFKYWPGGAPFALALSHDVDRLRAPGRRETLRAMLRGGRRGPRAGYTLSHLLAGAVTFKPWPAIRAAEEAAGGVSTFFIGAVRRGPNDYTYDLAEAAPVVAEVAAAGREVALHASYYAADAAALRQERDALAAVIGADVAGVRGHYLRLAGEPGWSAVGGAAFGYDASFGFAGDAGWRGGAALPYRPFAAADDRPYGFTLVPLAVMDGTLFQHRGLDAGAAFALARGIVDQAAAVGGVATLNWHYRAFPGGAFPAWGETFRRLVEHAVAAGGLPLTHAAVAARYRLNAALAVRRGAGAYAYELISPPPAPGDVVWEVPPGWRVAEGDVRTVTPRSFVAPGGGRTVKVSFARER